MRSVNRHPAWLLLFAVLLAVVAAVPAAADDDDNNVIRVRPRAVIRTGDGEEPEVIMMRGHGDPMRFEMLTSRGFLGVMLTPLTPELREHFGVPKETGVLVGRVEEDSPAAKAGIQVGDILTAVDGEKVEGAWDVGHAVREKDTGDNVAIELYRDGRAQTVTATVAERPRREFDVGSLIEKRHGRDVLLPIDPEALEPALERLQRFKLHEGDLQRRLEEMEKRLQELEKQLADRGR
jgi:membrane-associated protease RseP (regulator of RpoE activity)